MSSDPFKAAATVLKKTLDGLKVDAKKKYDHAQKVTADAKKTVERVNVDVKAANDASAAATNVFHAAQARYDAFFQSGEDAPQLTTPFKAKVTAKATVKKAKASPKKAKASPKKVAKKKAAKKVVAKKATKKASVKKAKAAPKKAAKKFKAKANAKAKPKKKGTQAAAARGRQEIADGKRPVLREAMAIVMGKKSMDSAGILDGLEKKGWTPNAQNPRQYVSYMLSSNKNTFQRTKKRGFYIVKANASFGKRKAAAPVKAKAAVKAPIAKTTPTVAPAKVDATLNDLGLQEGNVAPNPFAASATT